MKEKLLIIEFGMLVVFSLTILILLHSEKDKNEEKVEKLSRDMFILENQFYELKADYEKNESLDRKRKRVY